MEKTLNRILLIQPTMEGPGGGDGVAAWTAQALWPYYDLTVLTWNAIETKKVDRYFGTELTKARINWLSVQHFAKEFIDAIPFRHALLEASFLQHYARKLHGQFDLRIFSLCEASFEAPGIQYIHTPWTLHPWSDVGPEWYRPPLSWLRVLYEKFCQKLCGYDAESVKCNKTLANSQWTADAWSVGIGSQAQVVYPPAAMRLGLPWSERANGFVCIGRLAEDKRVELVIEILAAARKRDPSISLHVVGQDDSIGYARELRNQAAQCGDWVTFHKDLSREELARLIGQNRYGIHGKQEEHFGMAIAEMTRAGSLVFVPNGGGQREIVCHKSELIYDDREDATRKILEIVENAELQQELLQHLSERAVRFSPESFQAQIRDVVASHQ